LLIAGDRSRRAQGWVGPVPGRILKAVEKAKVSQKGAAHTRLLIATADQNSADPNPTTKKPPPALRGRTTSEGNQKKTQKA